MSFQWSDAEVRQALGLNPDRGVRDLVFASVCTDSRNVQAGDLFVALEGEHFDGHGFVAEALGRGAAGAVVSKSVNVDESARLYPVDDTLMAFGALARHRLEALDARVVAITGSAGKTMTKDFLRQTLAGSLRVHATPGNLNNRVGLPRTVLATPPGTRVLVLEMGTNEPGEIEALTRIARPEMGIITTVGESHLEKLGSFEGVLEEKLDLLRGLGRDGLAIVGDEPPVLADRARELVERVLVAGESDRADEGLRPAEEEVTERGCYRFLWRGQPVRLQVPGSHAVRNALLALAAAEALGVPPEKAARRIGQTRPGSMRSEVRLLGSLTVLVDCYNASPQSVRAALDLLVTMQQLGPRVAVLGSMLELGTRARVLHRQVLEDALSRPLDTVIVTGLFAEAADWIVEPADGPELLVASGLEEAGKMLLERLGGTEVILLKASRGVAMETLMPALEERFGGGAVSSCEPAGGEA